MELKVDFFTISLVVLLFGCTGREPSKTLGFEAPSIDTLYVPLPVNVSPSLIFPHVFIQGGREQVLFYDHFDHSFSVIDVSERLVVKKISLTKDGPDFVESVGSMTVLGDNRIAVAGMNFITVMNFEGKVSERFSINSQRSDLNGLDFDMFELEYNQYSGLQYDPNSESLLFNINPLKRSEPQRYAGSKVAEVSLSNRIIRPVAIFTPSRYQSLDGDYGELVKVGVLRQNDKFVYNYLDLQQKSGQ